MSNMLHAHHLFMLAMNQGSALVHVYMDGSSSCSFFAMTTTLTQFRCSCCARWCRGKPITSYSTSWLTITIFFRWVRDYTPSMLRSLASFRIFSLPCRCCQIAAQELRVPLKDVFTSETASNTVPNTVPTAASAGSESVYISSNAVSKTEAGI